ncbi:hypothetical protein AX15_003176 [Amanita polypyramis BW_CC]|nr:hypothetical protein AX15_003176 [Amanita polypyramis BW_CC]
MASLSDQIDHFHRFAKAIRATAAHTALACGKFTLSDIGVAGPFTRAVLDTQLGDLIRDIDPSELGLFHLVDSPHPPSAEKHAARPPPVGVTRVEFGNATPLRRTIPRRDDHIKHNIEPEVYAQAAIKYIDRYDPIRPMPRTYSQATAILQQLNDVRQNIKSLLQSLERIQSEEAPPLKLLSEREEERTAEIKAEIAGLKQRRQITLTRHSSTRNEKTLRADQTASRTTLPLHCKQEFTPVNTAKALHFTENLMDEVIDVSHIADVSDVMQISDPRFSFETRESVYAPYTLGCSVVDEEAKRDGAKEDIERCTTGITSVPQDLPIAATSLGGESASSELQQPHPNPAVEERSFITQYRIQSNKDIERITTKIWRAAPDIINPNYQPITSDSNTSTPPRAKEVLARLQSLSELHVSSSSPSATAETTSSAITGAQPTSQQILIAHLLLTLLSTPHFALPLNKIKDALAAKSGGSDVSASGQGTSRVIYGCVAKRLVKIDRSGREQIVRFDI